MGEMSVISAEMASLISETVDIINKYWFVEINFKRNKHCVASLSAMTEKEDEIREAVAWPCHVTSGE